MMRLALLVAVLGLLSGCCGRWQQLSSNPDYDPDNLRPEPAPVEQPLPPASYNSDPMDTQALVADGTKLKSPGTTFSDPR